LACGDYEIVRALKDGDIEPDGIDLIILTDMDSRTRHWRFIRNREFDMAEPSASSYIVAREAEEAGYYRRTGIFPIMHVLGIRREIVECHPWVPINMFQAFEKAKAAAMRRLNNPRIVPLAWYREAWEEQERILGPDPWQYGLTDRNRVTLDTLAAILSSRD
jgi:hypothetical protein